MAVQLQLRSGTATEHDTFTGANGEVTVDTTKNVLVVHDGITAGGFPVAAIANADGTVSLIKKDGTSAGEVNSAGLFNNTLTSTNTNQALTAAQGKFLNDQAFGVGQTWQDVLASRSKGVTYTNTTGRAIEVSVSATYQDDDGGLEARVGGILVGNLKGEAPSGTGFWNGTLTFTVPNLTNYNITGNPYVFVWSELR